MSNSMSTLAAKDPEFYEFLKSEDQGLLDFNVDDEEDDDEEGEDGADDGDNTSDNEDTNSEDNDTDLKDNIVNTHDSGSGKQK